MTERPKGEIRRRPAVPAQRASRAGGQRATRTATSPWRSPGPTGDGLEIDEFPSFLLSRLGSLAKTKLMRLYLDDAGLSWPEWRLLTILTRFSPTSYPAIVQLSTMDKGQISLTLRTLVARGWVTWTEETTDKMQSRRRPPRVVTITAAGRDVVGSVLPHARRAQMRLLTQLPRDDRVELHRLLRKTLEALENMEGQGPE